MIASRIQTILVSATINDIGISTMLRGMPNHREIDERIEKFTKSDLLVFLVRVSNQFPIAAIYVTGYYQMFSHKSEVSDRTFMTALFYSFSGNQTIARMLVDAIPLLCGKVLSRNNPLNQEILRASLLGISNNCEYFSNAVRSALKETCTSVNNNLSSMRCFFVDPEFEKDNAVSARNSFIFGFSDNSGLKVINDVLFNGGDLTLLSLGVADAMAPQRSIECDLDRGSSLKDRIFCKSASIGHPTPTGAARYASKIIEKM